MQDSFIYTIQSISDASISVRDLTYISIKAGAGTGQLLTTVDENDIAQYFYINGNEVIQIADISITDTYNGIPVSLMRPFVAETIIEAAG